MSFLSFSSTFFVGGGVGSVGAAVVSLERLIVFCTGSFAARRAGSPHKVTKVFTIYNVETFGHVESKNQD